MTVTPAAILIELRRELAMREKLYPGWVSWGKLSQRTADHRIACIVAAIELIEVMPMEPEPEEQMSLLQ